MCVCGVCVHHYLWSWTRDCSCHGGSIVVKLHLCLCCCFADISATLWRNHKKVHKCVGVRGVIFGTYFVVMSWCFTCGASHDTNKVLATFPSLLWFFKGKYTLILSLTMSSVLDKLRAAWEQIRKFIFFHSYISNNYTTKSIVSAPTVTVSSIPVTLTHSWKTR